MLVRIEKGSAIPISRQIADQLRAQCLSGAIKAGTQIPSNRQLARELAVNQNTVLRVYERLTAENLLEMRHGEGTFVSADVPTKELNGQKEQFFDEVKQLVRQGQMLGIDGPGLHTMLDSALTMTHQENLSIEIPSGETA